MCAQKRGACVLALVCGGVCALRASNSETRASARPVVWKWGERMDARRGQWKTGEHAIAERAPPPFTHPITIDEAIYVRP